MKNAHVGKPDLFRDAVDIACGDEDRAPLGRVNAVHKIICGNPRRPKLSPEDFQAAGYAVDHSAGGMVILGRQGNELVKKKLSTDEMIEVCYRFSLAETAGAINPKWADFQRFAWAYHCLDQSIKKGKKIQSLVSSHPLWRIESHVQTTETVRYRRRLAADLNDEDDDFSYFGMYEFCAPDAPDAAAFTERRTSLPVMYLRPKRLDEQPRIAEFVVGPEDRRVGWSGEGLQSALNFVMRLPVFVFSDGARFEISRQPENFPELNLTFSQARKQWLDASGAKLAWSENGNAFLMDGSSSVD